MSWKIAVCVFVLVTVPATASAYDWKISWQANAEADSVLNYHVYEIIGGDSVEIQATLPSVLYLIQSDVDEGVVYRYFLKASNKYGYSSASDVVEGLILTEATTDLCRITESVITPEGEVSIRWDSSEPATGGVVYRLAGTLNNFSDPIMWDGEPQLEHTQIIELPRGYAYEIRAFSNPEGTWRTNIGLPVEVDLTGTVPDVPKAWLYPF